MGLKKYLTDRNYYAVKLKKTKTNHFEVKAAINGTKGRFILDTGASNSCVGFEEVNLFDLTTEASEHKAAGAGTTEIETQLSKDNTLTFGKFRIPKVDLVLLDLEHINTAMIKQDAKPVNGIIGADILEKCKAIIDYNKKKVYLSK